MVLKFKFYLKIIFKIVFISVFIFGFYGGVCAFVLPQSFNLLYTSLITYPLYNDSDINSKNYTIFLNHFTDNPEKSISFFNLKTSKKLAFYLLIQSYRNDIPEKDKQNLRKSSEKILLDLQKFYPFDADLMLSKADILVQKKQFIQAFSSVSASYYITQCYKPIMEYRLKLKQNYNVFVKDKLNNDIINLENNNCEKR